MNRSDVTTSPDFEDVRRTATLEALARHEFAPRDDPAATIVSRSITAPQFATAWVAGSVDSSTADPTSRLVGRIVAATKHQEITDVLPLIGLRAIADRLDYLHDISGDDPDEPSMVLASLRQLALFFVSEQPHGEPEIGISPDGHLQAEWRVGDGGFLAMKFLSDGLIQFAAISGPAGGRQRFRVSGTMPKDGALDTVRAFIRRGPF